MSPVMGCAKRGQGHCAVIKNDAERLVCYDKVSGRSKGTKKSLKEGRWRASVTREPLDDSKTTHLFLVAESGRNYKSDRPRLNIRCMSKEQELYITWYMDSTPK